MIYWINYVSFKAVHNFTIIKYHIKMLKHRHFTMRGVLVCINVIRVNILHMVTQ